MTELVLHRESTEQAIVLPQPRVPGGIAIRPAVAGDLAFIDDLQKKHSKSLGFAPHGQLQKNIADGHILIAEEVKKSKGANDQSPNGESTSFGLCDFDNLDFATPVGYCIAKDRYKDHDDVGIVYQLAVAPGKQRGLIGATLIKAVFDRAAYGCKLFCCWCAQDLDANYFWESIGFVPLAFRTGSRKVRGKDGKMGPRIHIFWQRRIREGDTETPYWYPAETSGGAVKENRLVLPIPPGTHWSDAKPAVLPGMEEALKALPGGAGAGGGPVEKKPRVREKKAAPILKPPRRKVGVWFAPPPPTPEQIAATRKAKPPKQRFKNDPKFVAAARELRDRYVEQINAGLLLPPSASGKYDVSRQLEAASSSLMKDEQGPGMPLLEAA